jgi:hypothetical protein
MLFIFENSGVHAEIINLYQLCTMAFAKFTCPCIAVAYHSTIKTQDKVRLVVCSMGV